MAVGDTPTMDARQERGARLLAEVSRLAGVSGLTFVHHSGQRIAQAESGDPVVRATTPLLDGLNDAELKAVLAHEAGHVVRARQGINTKPMTPAQLRAEEILVDAMAVRWTRDPASLASALLKIAVYNQSREGVRAGGHWSDHPALRTRMRALRHVTRELHLPRLHRVAIPMGL